MIKTRTKKTGYTISSADLKTAQ